MSEQIIQNINKSDINFASTFVNHIVLQDINFNWHYFINNNFSIPKKVLNLMLVY